MASLQELSERFHKGATDVLGVDVGRTATKLVRVRKSNDVLTLSAADILPAQEFPSNPMEETNFPALALSAALKGRLASVCIAGDEATVKLINYPGAFDESSTERLIESLGIEEPDQFRIGYRLLTQGHGRQESRVLAIALPETLAHMQNQLFPLGLPAPFSLEISGIAAMSAFLHGPGEDQKNDATGAIDFGTQTTTFAIFNKGTLALIRRLPFGTYAILDDVQDALGVDMETAQGILTDGAFDISQSVTRVMEPFLKQLIVSRDFVERREDCRIDRIYVTGGLSTSHDAMEEMNSSLGIETVCWDPFDNLEVAPTAIPEQFNNQRWRFSAAVGAALATFEES